MPAGIRATVEFTSSDICPIVDLSSELATTIDSVNSNVCPDGEGRSVVEFSLDDDDVEMELTPILSLGSSKRYRLTLDEESACPCKYLSQFGCPVVRYVAANGKLTLVFHTTDFDQLQEVITGLRHRYPKMDIRKFVRSPAGEGSEDSVFIDRNKFTDRQLEVLETAYEMGYFERPRRANATEIAAELDINPSTFREHIAAAEQKAFADLI
jgi:hypothetical protein